MNKKKLLLVLLNFGLLLATAHAQFNERQFDEALKLYNNEQYSEAAQKFAQIPTEKALLFAGKSYYAATNYTKAMPFLQQAGSKSDNDISTDALHTLALTHFQLRNYSQAVDILYSLKQGNAPLNRRANTLYNQILNYLTLSQKKEVFQHTTLDEIRFDIVSSSIGKVDYNTAKILLQALKKSTNSLSALKTEPLEKTLRDSISYAGSRESPYTIAPEGMVYNVGIALPKFDTGTNEFNISRSMYLGYLKAAEEFNQQHTDKKVYLQFKNTLNSEHGALEALHTFAWNRHIDAIIGPLFSESVRQIDRLSEEYQIPILAPLANSDSLSGDNPYLFQVNPTFSVRGKRMAEFAVNNLRLDTLAVIAEKNSLGAGAAYAFRTRAEELGAFVPYLFVDDLESKGYDMSDYSQYFSTDSTLIDSLNIIPPNAVYAPFTGQGASTLINLFLTDLESHKNYLTVLGSEEWKNTDISSERLKKFDIYHTQGFEFDTTRQSARQFDIAYKDAYGFNANQFSAIAYDTAKYLFAVLDKVGNPALLKVGLKQHPLFQGVSTNIHFAGGTHINQSLQVKQLGN